MIYMKQLSLLVALGAAAISSASFDLVMVMDYGTKSIHRFDGSTGLYLGQFANGHITSMSSFAINRATGSAYIADSSAQIIREFNFNTGNHINDFTVSGNFPSSQSLGVHSNGNLHTGYVAGGSLQLSNSGQSLGFHAHPLINTIAAVPLGSTVHRSGKSLVYASDLNGSALSAGSVHVVDPSSPNSPVTVASVGFTGLGDYNRRTQIAVSSGDKIGIVSSNGGFAFGTTDATASSVTMSSFGTVSGTRLVAPSGLAYGHGLTMYMSGKDPLNTARGRINRLIHGSPSNVLASFGEDQLIDPGQMAIVVAPEPGSLLMLAVGGMLLLRRKR
jgi:hypothetical protein